MSTVRMHADEVPTDAALVRRLLTRQFPDWAELPIEPVPSAGTDNALYRLGDNMAVRLPRIGWAVGQAEKEMRWLPLLTAHLPVAIPTPLAIGEPDEGYPWSWSVYRWLEGENVEIERLDDPLRFARDLAGFVTALQAIDTSSARWAGTPRSSRGVPLAARDADTRAAIESLRGMLDTDAATAAWDAALAAPEWQGTPVWTHGDLQAGNLLVREGRLSAVIDFGILGVGDPACDMLPAWNLFSGETRVAYRAGVGVDDATWDRGRGWALSVSLIALPYYRTTNPYLAGISRFTIDQVLAEHRG